MTLQTSSIVAAFRSARPALWVPILLNTGLVSFLLTQSFGQAALLGFSLSCMAGFGFLINDLKDIGVDKDNRAGKLDAVNQEWLPFIKAFTVFMGMLAIVLSVPLGLRALLGMIVVGAGLIVYTYIARPKLFLANALAAVLGSTPLWLPNLVFAVAPPLAQWGIIGTAAILLLGREIIFDVADAKGDAKGGRRTFPIVFGSRTAILLAVLLQLAGCVMLLSSAVFYARSVPSNMSLFLAVAVPLFLALVVPAALRLALQHANSDSIQAFTIRTRLAMLLLPLIVLVFLKP